MFTNCFWYIISRKMEILNALINGFINEKNECDEQLLPRLLTNDFEKGEKVITSIIHELLNCDEFLFSVAFLTVSGVQVLLNTLLKLKEKNVKGIIIVSQYQNFTDPVAMDRLRKFENIELRFVTEDVAKMHTKGYIFKKQDEYTFIVGSSNLTQNALCQNIEWNIKICGKNSGSYYKKLITNFNDIYKLSTLVDDKLIEEYKYLYEKYRISNIQFIDEKYSVIKPNSMQNDALSRLKQIREDGANKALIISATGTGKTYLSAFDVANINPNKFLFIVHREQIALDAERSYKRVLGKNISTGLIGGGKFSVGKYNFAMIQTLSKDDVLHSFKKDEFDLIVVDEIQHGGSPNMQKVINYFTPKFLLGMTATPERTDGFDIYKMFDYNIAYEIRLQDAIREEMVCPFHYYGIHDIKVDGKLIDDKTDFNLLIGENRVKHILDTIETYGYQGDKVRGLIFVSRKEEAKILSDLFNKNGYRTVALTGEDNQETREKAINRLSQEENINCLDYIFSVDIFNEGIDIPKINQIVMLRPTQSSIVFIQQLGRGLRKYQGKEYVVVLDFIGNYENNFLIPIALSGDKSFNKDNMRKVLLRPTLYGSSTIEFDKVSESRIYNSIDKANFKDAKLIKDSYIQLKQKLGRIPSIRDFDNYGSIDIMRIVEKYKSYHLFLSKVEKEYNISFDDLATKYISFVSQKYLCGKRPHELEFLNLCLQNNSNDLIGDFQNLMVEKYPNIKIDSHTIINLINQMTQNYLSGSEKNLFTENKFLSFQNEKYIIDSSFQELLNNNDFLKIMNEIIENGLLRYNKLYKDNYEKTNFKLYEKYTYEDVCRELDWYQNQVALNIGGYKFDKETNTLPVFINYDKPEEIQNSIKYEDRFINNSSLIALSKSNRTINSADIQILKNFEKNNTKILLFVRKNKDDNISKEFYFLGMMRPNSNFNEITMNKTESTAVEIEYKLSTPVRDDIFDYLIS